MENRKEKLIDLINKFENQCLDCGKLFLGVSIDVDNSSPTDMYPAPVNIKINPYPLSCGKCPDCTKKCYVGNREFLDEKDLNYEVLLQYVRRNGKIPCRLITIYDHFDIEDNANRLFSDEEMRDFIDSQMEDVDCQPYVDIFYFHPEFGNDVEIRGRIEDPKPWDESKDFIGGKLVNLFELFENELK